LLHAAPPIELLSLTKEFAKANMDHPDSSLPKEVAAVLYYASISAALARRGERISQLNDAELERGLRWAKDQPWVDKQIQHLLVQALNKLSNPA
jgi:predicted transcriptional regulator